MKWIGAFLFGSIALFVSSVLAEEMFPDNGIELTYNMYCAECHGSNAEGTTEGSPLVNVEFLKKSERKIIEKILKVGVEEGSKRFSKSELAATMPGFSEDLTNEEIDKLTQLIKSWNK